MADNTVQSGADTIATDDVGTLNGAASSGVKVQRTKVGYGDDGLYRDVSSIWPLPSFHPNASVTGAITAANANVDSGTGTANSYITLTVPEGHTSWTVDLRGVWSAGTTIAFQCSLDNVNWFFTNGRRNMNTLGVNETISLTSTDVVGGAAPTGGNPSLWKGTAGGVKYFRVTATTLTGGDSVTVSIISSAGPGGTFLLGSIPAGTSVIGSVKKAPSSTGTITSVTAAAASTQLLAANTNRLGATFYNDSTATLYLALSTAASVTSYTCQVVAGGYFELPNDSLGYVGAIYGIWSAVNGAVRITELT